jgi:hypothetical protein
MGACSRIMAFDTSEPLARTDFGDELLPGTVLFHGTFRITRFINSGGFGITYLAQDSLGRDVAGRRPGSAPGRWARASICRGS